MIYYTPNDRLPIFLALILLEEVELESLPFDGLIYVGNGVFVKPPKVK